MKKINMKKFLSSVMATAIVGSTFSAVTSFAAAPSIYVDIVYEDDDTARADVYISNMPDLISMGFHIDVGEGWDIPTKSNDVLYTSLEGCVLKQRLDDGDAMLQALSFEEYHDVFFAVASKTALDWNGKLISFYIEKNENYTADNAALNVYFNELDELRNSSGINISETASIPEMIGAYEFIVGDANGDNTILASDAAKILNVANTYTSLNVNSIKDSFTTYFENAACAAAPDADRNGVITSEDAQEVLDAYSAIQAGLTYNGMVGKKDVFEIFN